MKKTLYILVFLIGSFSGFAQEKTREKAKDSIKTEVIEVITTYNPKLADATKIKKNPKVKVFEKNKKKKLEYTIFSAPVASTFIPKTGAIKGINIGEKERIYENHIKAGFGNFKTSLLEGHYNRSSRFNNEYGASFNYITSRNNVDKTVLKSTFSNFDSKAFYKQIGRYFDWKVDAAAKIDWYHWYGVEQDVLDRAALISIDAKQNYNHFKLGGELDFHDSYYIEKTDISVNYFTDKFESQEIQANFNAKLKFPLHLLSSNLDNDIIINSGVEFLNGQFKNDYNTNNTLSHNILTFKVAPEFKMMSENNFILETSLKNYASIDTENNATNILILPNIKIQKPIIGSLVSIYGGFYSDLKTNTYHNFVEENPFVSPTLFITQTLEKQNIFAGLNGKINNKIIYNFKYSIINEEDKPLFLRNNSKFNISVPITDRLELKPYEYGNSFGIFYDDVTTNSIFTEVEYNLTPQITLSSYAKYNNYKLTNALEAWNLPSLKASLSGTYSDKNWFGAANIFYLSERSDILFNAPSQPLISGIQNINAIIDINLKGGYDFSRKLSSFINVNNVLNSKIQQFANFDTQGFQIIAGLLYKFDF